MTITSITINELSEVQEVAHKAFSITLDADLSSWFSFSEMEKGINENRGACFKAIEQGEIVGMIYAQQENPINGPEGLEKWVIVILAVDPESKGKGIGSKLLEELEIYIKEKQGKKLFVYTNKDDEDVISFYRKNGYEDAGWVKDYQYGKGNSAAFLLKHLG